MDARTPFQHAPGHLTDKAVAAHGWHSYTKSTDLLKILIHAVIQKPYLGYACKQNLALEATLKSLESKSGFRTKS